MKQLRGGSPMVTVSTTVAFAVVLAGCGDGADNRDESVGPPSAAAAVSVVASASDLTISVPTVAQSTGSAVPGEAVAPGTQAPTLATAPPGPGPAPAEDALESLPAVQAVRLHFRGLALAINQLNLAHPDLIASTTPQRLARIVDQGQLEEDYGQLYPGPAPATVTGVSPQSGTPIDVEGCLQWRGYGVDQATGMSPASDYHGFTAVVVDVGGQLLVDQLLRIDTIDCTVVPLRTEVF